MSSGRRRLQTDRPPIPLFAFLFTNQGCKIQQGWERLPETCLISPPISP